MPEYRNSEGERIAIETCTAPDFAGQPILSIFDDPPPHGTGTRAPTLLDEGAIRWLLDQLQGLTPGHSPGDQVLWQVSPLSSIWYAGYVIGVDPQSQTDQSPAVWVYREREWLPARGFWVDWLGDHDDGHAPAEAMIPEAIHPWIDENETNPEARP